MDGVKDWSESRGWDYKRVGDEIFDLVPKEYREKSQNEIHLMVDLARLILAHRFLSRYERVVWLDADVLILDPDSFLDDWPNSFAFSHEIWLNNEGGAGVLKAKRNINNAVCCFCRPDARLNFFIDATYRRVMDLKNLRHFDASTTFLSQLNDIYTLPQFLNVALFSPHITQAILKNEEALVQWYGSQLPSKVKAVNLCLTFVGNEFEGIKLTDRDMECLIKILRNGQGEVINQWVQKSGPSLARIFPEGMKTTRNN